MGTYLRTYVTVSNMTFYGEVIWLDGCVGFEHRSALCHRLKEFVIWARNLFGCKHS